MPLLPSGQLLIGGNLTSSVSGATLGFAVTQYVAAGAANTKPFLLQTYRRDMGGGNFVLMKDLSSPIRVRGRHWGAFRMGFRQS